MHETWFLKIMGIGHNVKENWNWPNTDEARKTKIMAIPWWSRGQDSALPLQGAQFPSSLVGELRSHVPLSAAKKNQTQPIQNKQKHKDHFL